MGAVKNIAIKTLARELIEQHGGTFTDNFEKNKKILQQIRPIASKKVRNSVAGYITREVKRIQKTGL